MILTSNKKLKKQLHEQAILYGLDILDEANSNIYEPNQDKLVIKNRSTDIIN